MAVHASPGGGLGTSAASCWHRPKPSGVMFQAKHPGFLLPSNYSGISSFFSNTIKRTFCCSGKNTAIPPASSSDISILPFAWPDKQKPRVCILGAGFGGLYTALRLESLIWPDNRKPQVLLVDQSDRFVFKPMLYELLSGEVDVWEVAPLFSELLKNTSIKFIKDRVKFLHPNDPRAVVTGRSSSSGIVYLENGMVIEYDWLVLSLGAEAKVDAIPGSSEFAFPFWTLEDAMNANNELRLLEREKIGKKLSPIRVGIVGCGYNGVELAATIAERLQKNGIVQAINVQSTICPNAFSGNREAALKVLQTRNVELYLGYFVSCIRKASASNNADSGAEASEVDNKAKNQREKLILELQPALRGLKSQNLEADLVLWTVGTKSTVPELQPSDEPSLIPLNGRGQVETEETLQVRGHPRMFAIGDSAALRDPSGKLLPSTAQVAFQQADFAGWNLWAAINDRPLLPFRYQNLGEMMTLGKNDGAITPSFVDGLTLDGPLGHAARKMVYLLRMPTDEHRLKVGISWLTKTAIDSIASIQNTVADLLTGSS